MTLTDSTEQLHFHGSIEAAMQTLTKYNNRKGMFIKKFLIDSSMNQNKWKVTRDAIKKDIKSFIGQPTVLTPDKNHPPTSIQDQYKVGTIIDVGIDESTGKAWQVTHVTDKRAQEMIKSKEIQFGSPTVISAKKDSEIRNRGTASEEYVLHRFKGMHDALVANPAYGKDTDYIPAYCEGEGTECGSKLLQVQADLSDSSTSEITIVPFVKHVIKKRFKACTLKKYDVDKLASDIVNKNAGKLEAEMERNILDTVIKSMPK